MRWIFLVMRLLGRVSWWLTRRCIRIIWRLAVRLLRKRVTTHGSARWAGWLDLLRGRVWGGRDGLIVGKAFGRFLRHRGEGAALVFAPMGSGKGVGIVVPNLLDYRGSVICTDPKGENLAVTGRWRRTFGDVYRIDAQHPSLSHCFNPFDMIRVGTHHQPDDVAALAELLVIPESGDSHWDTSARQLIAMMIAYVIHTRPRVLWTLGTVRQIICLGADSFGHELTLMSRCGNAAVEEEARITLAGLEHDETRSIIKNAAKALQFWSHDRIGGLLTSRSDFDLLDMHRRTMTVYIIVPEDKLRIYQPFLRVMMGCAIASAVRGKDLPRPLHKPLLLIDELAALGRLDALEQGIGYLRAYTRLLLVLQDLGQLRRVYGKESATSFLAASGCQVAFNVNDNTTAGELAETLGRTTILSRSQGVSHARSELLPHHEQHGIAETGRQLQDPAEVRRELAERCFVIMAGRVRFPIKARKIRHYAERCWRGRWDHWNAATPLPSPEAVRETSASDGADAHLTYTAGALDDALRHA